MVGSMKGVMLCFSQGGGLTAYEILEDIYDYDELVEKEEKLKFQNLGVFVGVLSKEELEDLLKALGE